VVENLIILEGKDILIVIIFLSFQSLIQLYRKENSIKKKHTKFLKFISSLCHHLFYYNKSPFLFLIFNKKNKKKFIVSFQRKQFQNFN